MQYTPIQWTWAQNPDGSLIPMSGMTWNPILGCRRVSPGCGDATGGGCYAERLIATRLSRNPKLPMYHDIARLTGKGQPQFTGVSRMVPDRLDAPLRRRKGVKVFVCDMGDLFFEGHSFEDIAAVWGVMASSPQHTFQVLTKRPARAREFFVWLGGEGRRAAAAGCPSWQEGVRSLLTIATVRATGGAPFGSRGLRGTGDAWPLPNVWLGVSVENQREGDRRAPQLLECPAAIHFLSVEPLLEGVDMRLWFGHGITWAICGGESGPSARPFDIAWMRSLRDQCARAGVAYFGKQFGSHPVSDGDGSGPGRRIYTRDSHGGDMTEWPHDLRVRQFPRVAA